MDIYCADIEKRKTIVLKNILNLYNLKVETRYELELRGINLSHNLHKYEELTQEFYQRCYKRKHANAEQQDLIG